MAKTRIDTRPTYHHGQLLLEDDFLAEQRYHAEARCRHSLNLHGWGVVRGLEVGVPARGGACVTVEAGYAVDPQGREIELPEAVRLDLSGCAPDSELTVALRYEEEEAAAEDDAPAARVGCLAVVEALPAAAHAPGVALAGLRLDAHGLPVAASIDPSRARRVLNRPAPGSVRADSLDASLRRGWLRTAFRPIALERGPAGEDTIPPPFRVGATECRSYEQHEGRRNDRGAGGTMALALPPGSRRLHRFRIAGEENQGGIELKLVLGGWDLAAGRHVRQKLVDETIREAPYARTFELGDTELDPECGTLSIWLLGRGKTSVSLVAVELSC